MAARGEVCLVQLDPTRGSKVRKTRPCVIVSPDELKPVISEYMPGGGGRKAANHVFRSARPDGLTIGNVSASMIQLEILGEAQFYLCYDIVAHLDPGRADGRSDVYRVLGVESPAGARRYYRMRASDGHWLSGSERTPTTVVKGVR